MVDSHDERWLILGASGWFGRTLLSLAKPEVEVMAVGGSSPGFSTWSEASVEAFGPTHVFGFAFLTKEKLARMGLREYVSVNKLLINRFQFAASRPSCRAALTVSSGSVVTDPDHPYSQLKVVEERVCESLTETDRGTSILRAYSVSGPFMQRIQDYAFGSILEQAISNGGRINIRAEGEVWRRYVDVGDALGVCLSLIQPGQARMIETGGELVEIHDLANLVATELNAVVNPRAELHESVNFYASDNASWNDACKEANFNPKNLVEQIWHSLSGCKLNNFNAYTRWSG